MTFLRRFGVLALAFAAAVSTGCQRSAVIAIPPAPPARMFVANFLTSKVVAYAQPLGPSSTANATLATGSEPDGIAADSLGSVYVPNLNVIYVYAPPISATTSPATFAVTGAVNFRGLNFDQQGNLWITDPGSESIFELKVPFTGSPVTPIRQIQCACFVFPIEAITDIAGHLFVADNGGAVRVFNIPAATGTSVLVPVATITSPTGSAIGLASDKADHLFVTEDNNMSVMVYNPPFATGNLPVSAFGPPLFTDSACVVPLCEALLDPAQAHFDANGNLVVAYQFDTTASVTGGIAVFPPPFNSGTAQTFIIQGAASGMTNPVDLTFAP